jgi:large subunit ribosomal protein L7/L12
MSDTEEKKVEETTEAPAAEETKEETKAEEVKEEAAPAADAADAADDAAEVEVPEKFKKLVEEVENMSVLELHELVKVLEKKFDVSAAAVAVAAPGAAAGGAAEEEQSSFTVELADAGAQKIAVIKAIKEMLGLGLKEAKELVDGAPSPLKENVAKEEAEEMKAKIEEAGGKVELK